MNLLAVIEKHQNEFDKVAQAERALDNKLRDDLVPMLGESIDDWDFEAICELINLLPNCSLKSELLEYYDSI